MDIKHLEHLALSVLGELEKKPPARTAYVKHYQDLYLEGRMNVQGEWGIAHCYAVCIFLAPHYYKHLSWTLESALRASKQGICDLYESSVSQEIKSGDHWGETAHLMRRMGGRAEDLFKEREKNERD